MTSPIAVTDIQFSGNDATNAKLRRLVQDLVAAERAVNALIKSLAEIEANGGGTGQILLANAAGLGSGVSVEGLTPGTFLKALTATSAAFAKLKVSDITDIAQSNPTNGQVLTYENGEYVNASLPASSGGASGENIGTGAGIYAGISGSKLAFKSITGDGSAIVVSFTGDTIQISFVGAAIRGPAGDRGPPGREGEPGDRGLRGPPGPPGTGSALKVTDGTTSVLNVDTLTVTGGTVSGTTPNANITFTGGGGGGVPGTIADLVYWFCADRPLVSAGNMFGVLPNSTPWNPSQFPVLTAGAGAARSATLLNSLGVATFPASSNYVLNAGVVLNQMSGFFVYKPASVSTFCTLVNGTANNSLGYYVDNSGKPSLVATGVAVISPASSALILSTWAQGNVTYNASTGAYAFRLNRTADGSGANAQTINSLSLGIGSDNSGGSPLNGDLAEFILYKRVLSGTEITNIENYLHTKWGV